MMNENQLKILELELKRKNILLEHYKKRLDKYLKLNTKVSKLISQDEIEDLGVEITTLELDIAITESKIKSIVGNTDT